MFAATNVLPPGRQCDVKVRLRYTRKGSWLGAGISTFQLSPLVRPWHVAEVLHPPSLTGFSSLARRVASSLFAVLLRSPFLGCLPRILGSSCASRGLLQKIPEEIVNLDLDGQCLVKGYGPHNISYVLLVLRHEMGVDATFVGSASILRGPHRAFSGVCAIERFIACRSPAVVIASLVMPVPSFAVA